MMGMGPGAMLDRETSKPKAVSATLRRFWQYFGRYRLVLVGVAALVIVSTYMQVLIPNLLGQAVDCYLTPATQHAFGATAAGGQTAAANTGCWYSSLPATATNDQYIAGLGGLVLLTLGLYLGGSLLGGLTFYLMSYAGQHVLRSLRVDVFQHIHRLSIGYFTKHEAGDVMSRITNDADTIQQVLGFALVSVVQGALLIVWIAFEMLRLNLVYALLALVVVPFMFFATLWFSSQARKAYRKVRTAVGDVNASLQENLSAVREVQAFGREQENIENFAETNAATRDATIRAVAYTSALAPTLEALGYVSIAIVTGVGGWILLNRSDLFGAGVSIGLIISFIAYVQRFNQPISQIAVLWSNIQSAIAGGERIFGLLDTVPDLQDAPDAIPMPPIQGRVVFDHVSAEYAPGQPVLRDISLSAEPGQTIAIVGPTGAGKTTIINLIPRFYDVVGGAVTIDGLDVRAVQAATLRAQVGIVLQDSFLFSDTVMSNIRFGRPDATDDEVKAAAQLARADSFIERLPDGYNTVLGERGAGVSQGQRQLLAIARAALANPRILILDEATSSVDTRTERLIQTALEELLRGRTSFVIAHRLSTIRHADLVVVLQDGQIIERGTHDELLAKHGFYYDLYMSQFRRDVDFVTADAVPVAVG
ncbi:MAG: ABC transporter ATP-binding protein/permease [Chloroflexota bacterium]|nr:ABC transporter ATP-binding protein/permease [Chloroflexota bacterium]